MQGFAKNVFAQDSWQTPRNARTLAAYMALQTREIGDRISALREARGNPPQEIVAQKLDVSNRAYQAWEAGDSKPSWRNLTKLAKFYGVTEEFILLGDVPEETPQASQLDRVEQLIRDQNEQIKGLSEELELLRAEIPGRAAAVMQRFEEVLSAKLPPRARQRR